MSFNVFTNEPGLDYSNTTAGVGLAVVYLNILCLVKGEFPVAATEEGMLQSIMM